MISRITNIFMEKEKRKKITKTKKAKNHSIIFQRNYMIFSQKFDFINHTRLTSLLFIRDL